MVNVKFITKWLKIEGKNLKGKELLITLMFLSFLITLIVISVTKVQDLF